MKNKVPENINAYLRPIKLAILFSVLPEAIIFLVWGVILYPEGNIFYKFLWTIIFCGLGMGSATGSIIALLVVNRLQGIKAIIACVLIAGILLGGFCDMLCFNLDSHFNYFGGNETPGLFIWSGLIMALFGGWFVGYLCFTDKGDKILKKFNI